MTNDDAGKSFITLDMDEERTLRWDFRNMQKFEGRAKEILKRLEIKNERGQLVSTLSIHTGYVLANFLRIADIMEAAVGAAIGVSALEGKKGEPSEASVAIQGYLDKGGDLVTLQNEVYHSYLVVNDPSSVAEFQANVAMEAEANQIIQDKKEAQLELARLDLATDLKKIETRKKLSGSEPATLPT